MIFFATNLKDNILFLLQIVYATLILKSRRFVFEMFKAFKSLVDRMLWIP